jgi:hypothetical protein
MTGFVLAKGTHQMPGRSWISIGRYQDGILRDKDAKQDDKDDHEKAEEDAAAIVHAVLQAGTTLLDDSPKGGGDLSFRQRYHSLKKRRVIPTPKRTPGEAHHKNNISQNAPSL